VAYPLTPGLAKGADPRFSKVKASFDEIRPNISLEPLEGSLRQLADDMALIPSPWSAGADAQAPRRPPSRNLSAQNASGPSIEVLDAAEMAIVSIGLKNDQTNEGDEADQNILIPDPDR
jgi:hypothetical protein